MGYRAGSGPRIHDGKTGEVEMRHIARRNRVTEFERNGRDHEIHRRPVAASELSSANGGPFVERHQNVSGDPLDITAAAKQLGDQMMEDYPEAVLARPTNSLKPNLARLPNRCPIPAFHLFTRLILTNRTSFRRLSRWAAFQWKLRAALGRPTKLRTGPSGGRPSPALNLSHGASAP